MRIKFKKNLTFTSVILSIIDSESSDSESSDSDFSSFDDDSDSDSDSEDDDEGNLIASDVINAADSGEGNIIIGEDESTTAKKGKENAGQGDGINLEDHGCESASKDTQGLHIVLEKYLDTHEGRMSENHAHNDQCHVCNRIGELVCCDYCNLTVHPTPECSGLLPVPRGTRKRVNGTFACHACISIALKLSLIHI